MTINDPRQYSFLTLMEGGKQDSYPNYRGVIDALESQRREALDQEGQIPEGTEAMGQSSQQRFNPDGG